MGRYNLDAFSVVMSHFGAGLSGKRSRAKYMEKPISQIAEEKNHAFTEEELKKQRELFVARLEVMKTNFELSNKKDKDGSGS